MFKPDRTCPKCWKTALGRRKEGDDSPTILPCYLSPTTPMGCSVSHLMHPDLDLWLELASLIGGDTSIAQALPLLDRAGATEDDYDVLMAIRSWAAEARAEERKKEELQKGR